LRQAAGQRRAAHAAAARRRVRRLARARAPAGSAPDGTPARVPERDARRRGRGRALSGTLYVVGTPIGNLADITLRAIDTLRAVDRIAAEDTRRTRALLSHLEIGGKPLSALEAHADERAYERLLTELEAGKSVAFVTDAGMPAVSDPGARLVARARERGISVVVIPGPSAVTAAIAASGLVEAPFCFFGFLPRKGRARQRVLERIARASEPVVIFESPARLRATLSELAASMPERRVAVCRELTKLHEEIVLDSPARLAALEREWRGEITLVIDRAADAP